MDYLELSIEEVKKQSNKLFNTIIKEYDYDLVIFIAKGSYLIASELSNLKNVPLIEIKAHRKGSILKKIIKPFLKLIPKKILLKIRIKEMNHQTKKFDSKRYINFNDKKYSKYLNAKKILIVDDSIDSGNTMLQVKEEINKLFRSEIKICVFNYMNNSIIKPDYHLYRDTMICGPWSNDSKYNKKFLKMYREWSKKEEVL